MKVKLTKRKLKTAYERIFRSGLKNIGRVIAAFVALLVVFEGISFPAHAESAGGEVPSTITKEGAAVKNTYILETTTGNSDGSAIEYIMIKYKANGQIKKKFIFPERDSLENGLLYVGGIGNDDQILQTISTSLGYQLKNDYKVKKALQSFATDQFVFQLPHKIDEVLDIRVLNKKVGTWTCLGLRVFEVEKIYGIQMAGVWSDCGYVDFKGHMIAELDRGDTSVGADKTDEFSLGNLRKDFTELAYANHDTQDVNQFGFRLDFSDYYKAGMEGQINDYTDNKASILNMGIAETMTFNVTYTDVYGQGRIVHLPGNTSTAYWLSQRIGSTPVLGFGQQGGSMGFTADLPDCAKIVSVTLSAGATDAMASAGIEHCNFAKASRRDAREKYADEDSMKYTCFAIYDMKQSVFHTAVEGALLKYYYGGTPQVYKLAGSAEGDVISSKGSTLFMLREYDGKPLEFETGKMEGYLVQLTTDDMAAAATAGTLTIRFKYKTMTGTEKETGEYNLIDAANNFYGFWPGSTSDFPYHYGFAPGQTLCFFLQVDGVDFFTGATLSLDGDKNDDYQLKSLKIYNISNTGEKVANWEELNSGGYASHVRVTRVIRVDGQDVDLSKPGFVIDGKEDDQLKKLKKAGAISILDIKEPVLLLPGEKRKIDFVSNSVGELEDSSFDPNKMVLTYMEAMQDYGFTKVRKSYNVTIKISDDIFPSDGNTTFVGDGDAGSKNNFYFQLVFDDGESGFVLANQQLLGDYFRSGSRHNIVIQTNHDYGDVTEIRIIPDTTTEDSLRKDKLKIEYIMVTEGNTKGTHKAWNFENIDWIGTDFMDNMQMYSISGKEGRTLSQIARKIPVSYQSNVIDVEIAIATGYGNKETGRDPSTGAIKQIYADQLQGIVTCKIKYLNNQGEAKETPEFDVVKSMYEYMGKTTTYAGNSGFAMSDPQYMFREGHTDRFTVQLTNVKQVTGMELYAKADNPYRWNIAGITGKIIKEAGRLRINTREEYQYECPNSGEEDIIFTEGTDSNPAYSFDVNEVGQTLKFDVSGVPITLNTQGETVVSYVRTPASKDDTLNVYVFPSGGSADPINMYDLNCKLNYTTAVADYQKYEELAKYNAENDPEKGRPMFLASGIEASKIIDLSRMILTVNTAYANACNIDFAIVQQERQASAGNPGTIINTYFFDIRGLNALYGIETYPSNDRSVLGYTEEQIVTLEFGPGTNVEGLYPERKDVGVAIEYKNSFDPTGTTHRSPIVYLTDQQINNIREGMTVDLKFNQLFVGEVTGLQIVATGDTKAVVKCACVATYRQEMDSAKRNMGWYSFSQGIALSNSLTPMTRTADTLSGENVVVPVKITFKTSDASAEYESGTMDPVRASVTYVDSHGNVMPAYEIMDLRKYLTDGSQNFQTGKTQSVYFMLTDAQSIRRITLEPKNEQFNGTAGWSIDTASLKFGDADVITRNVRKRFLEYVPDSIVFSNITVGATVHNFNVQKNTNDEHHVYNNTLNLIVTPGQSVYVTPTISGSELGYTINAYEVAYKATGEEYISGELVNSLVQEGDRYKFTPDANNTASSKFYRVVVKAKESEESKAVINITIASADQVDLASRTIQQYTSQMTEAQKQEQQRQQLEQNKANFATAVQQAISGYRNNYENVSGSTQTLYDKIVKQLEALTYDESISYEQNISKITTIVNQNVDETERAAAADEFNRYKEEQKVEAEEIRRNTQDADSEACHKLVSDAQTAIASASTYQAIADILSKLRTDLANQVAAEKLAAAKDSGNAHVSNSYPQATSEACQAIRTQAHTDIDAATSVDEVNAVVERFDKDMEDQIKKEEEEKKAEEHTDGTEKPEGTE